MGIFNVEQSNLKDVIRMRYKRVNNYNEMSAIESTIIDLIQNEVEEENIIKIIKDNYGLNEKEVIERLKDVLNSIQVIEKTGKKKKIKLKNNPGFLTTIKQDQFKNNITVAINNISNIKYIYILSIYIDSLIRITQYPDTTNVELEEIAPSPEKELEVEIAEELIFDSPEKVSDEKEDLLNILMGSDIDEDDEEIEIDEEEIEIDDEELRLLLVILLHQFLFLHHLHLYQNPLIYLINLPSHLKLFLENQKLVPLLFLLLILFQEMAQFLLFVFLLLFLFLNTFYLFLLILH